MTDDLGALDDRILSRLPNINKLFLQHGLTFDEYYGETPLCCPGRAEFLTGQHVRTNGVVRNDARLLDPTNTIATALQDAGYQTAFIGKYLNHSELLTNKTPPGWDYAAMAIYGDMTPSASVATSSLVHQRRPGYGGLCGSICRRRLDAVAQFARSSKAVLPVGNTEGAALGTDAWRVVASGHRAQVRRRPSLPGD